MKLIEQTIYCSKGCLFESGRQPLLYYIRLYYLYSCEAAKRFTCSSISSLSSK